MATFELPLDQLYTYQGCNPRPKDFDSYWERGLAEMHGTDPDIALVSFKGLDSETVECFDLYFTGVRGARIHAKYLRPKHSKKPGPAVLLFHGYSGNSGEWADKLNYVSQGYCVAALDCRGQGGLSEDKGGTKGNTHRGHIIRGLDDHPDNLLFRHIFLDTAQLARIVMGFPEVDANRVGAHGGSQGGALTLACAALEPRIRKAAPLYPFLSDYLRVWEMDLARDAYQELRDYFRLFDPRHERKDEVFRTLGYIDLQNLAPRIRADVLLFMGLMDTICPPSSQFATYNKITAPKQLKLYPDYGHEHLPGHVDMTFNFMAGL
ncbi:MAG: alpha/beta fold hydrolase [Methylacidiphilales bacterium]|nr:alpha/beta fold hydrolase [Candidatus Methylacidiphilales bacterium]